MDPLKNPADRQRCIDNLGDFMSTILRGVGEHTGLHAVCIFGGPIPQFNRELKTVVVAHGKNRNPKPRNFPPWAKARGRFDVLDFMKEYLHTAFTTEECLKVALPVHGSVPRSDAKYTNVIGDGPEVDDFSSSESDSEREYSDVDSVMAEDVMSSNAKNPSMEKDKAGKGKREGVVDDNLGNGT
ncbi:hypothetical protein C8R45DRAFT_285478 [Mycena sanguinolenta]|nr:hypothetical protein C8R45DRAFT_285478 [Mycena sanguinolenta]